MTTPVLDYQLSIPKQHIAVMVTDAILLDVADFATAQFAAQDSNLLILLADRQLLLEDYYNKTPILIDQKGNRLRPKDITEQVAAALHVNWGEKAKVFNSQLPLHSINEQVGIILTKQGTSGFLTADNKVLRDNDIFHLYESLVYYHNETGSAQDEIVLEQLGQRGVLRIIAD